SGPPQVGIQPGMVFNGYRILEVIGRGGMGAVYKAQQVELERLVALKVIAASGGGDSHLRERFRAEARAVARLDHPNIVRIYEVGEHEGARFFSMEFCPGGTLSRRLATGPLEARAAAELVRTLADAIQAAHQARVIHRDLKPANVLFTADGTPRIADFGLARRLDDPGQTGMGMVLG